MSSICKLNKHYYKVLINFDLFLKYSYVDCKGLYDNICRKNERFKQVLTFIHEDQQNKQNEERANSKTNFTALLQK